MGTKLEDQYVEAKAAAKLYAETETDLIKLKTAKAATHYIGKFLTSIFVVLLGFISCLMILMALGFALGEVFQSMSLGFLCAGGVGIVLTLLAAFLLRKILNRSLLQEILKKLYDGS